MTERAGNSSRNHYSSENVIVSSIDRRSVARVINFPRKIKGKVIVDIGSGASNMVARLRKKGAIAFGVDIGYSNIDRLIKNADYYSRDRTFWQEERKVGEKKFTLDYPFDPSTTSWASFGIDQKALLDFSNDARDTENSSYIAADARALPFPDESVDFAYSNLALTIFLSKDRNAFLRSVHEAVRILKPGGELQLFDWISGDDWSSAQIRNGRALLDSLRSIKIPFQEETVRRGAARLRIQKP
ncbi:MAG TPA: class I SAM-dependent methyltransferase [Candidatus Limnocylindrales bacterium]|nr:class I SAM-dependent methyltransferase [Candidatus Limnocylindrales bacterium]